MNSEQQQLFRELREIKALLYKLFALELKEFSFLEKIDQDTSPKLSFIKLAIGGEMPVGPATLTVGDKKTVSVLGFDQNGAPFPIDFTANPVTFSDDNEAVLADTPGSTVTDPITAVTPGVANIAATCAGFSDTEAVTVVAAPAKLSSIKISID